MDILTLVIIAVIYVAGRLWIEHLKVNEILKRVR